MPTPEELEKLSAEIGRQATAVAALAGGDAKVPHGYDPSRRGGLKGSDAELQMACETLPTGKRWLASSAGIEPVDDGGYILVLRHWGETVMLACLSATHLVDRLAQIEWGTGTRGLDGSPALVLLEKRSIVRVNRTLPTSGAERGQGEVAGG